MGLTDTGIVALTSLSGCRLGACAGLGLLPGFQFGLLRLLLAATLVGVVYLF